MRLSKAREYFLIEVATALATTLPTELINLAHSGQLGLPVWAVSLLVATNAIAPPIIHAWRQLADTEATQP